MEKYCQYALAFQANSIFNSAETPPVMTFTLLFIQSLSSSETDKTIVRMQV